MAKKVLVVDDEEYLLELVAVNLEPAGFEVIKAANGQEGLKKTITERPDLLVLDVRMPGLDGFEVCRQLKANPATKDIPVIFLSAYAQETDLKKGYSLGAEVYMKKPFDVEELVRTVKKILNVP